MKTYYTPKEIKQALKDKKKGERLKKNILRAHSNYLAQFQVHELIDLIECERLSGVDKIIHENNNDDSKWGNATNYSINLFRFRFFI